MAGNSKQTKQSLDSGHEVLKCSADQVGPARLAGQFAGRRRVKEHHARRCFRKSAERMGEMADLALSGAMGVMLGNHRFGNESVAVICSGYLFQSKNAVFATSDCGGTAYLRVVHGPVPGIFDSQDKFEMSRSHMLHEDSDPKIVSLGMIDFQDPQGCKLAEQGVSVSSTYRLSGQWTKNLLSELAEKLPVLERRRMAAGSADLVTG